MTAPTDGRAILRPISVRKDAESGEWTLYDLRGGLAQGWPPRPLYMVRMCCWAYAQHVAASLNDFYRGRDTVGMPDHGCTHRDAERPGRFVPRRAR